MRFLSQYKSTVTKVLFITCLFLTGTSSFAQFVLTRGDSLKVFAPGEALPGGNWTSRCINPRKILNYGNLIGFSASCLYSGGESDPRGRYQAVWRQVCPVVDVIYVPDESLPGLRCRKV